MSSRPPFWSLCPAEPFRIFFPLATLLGISGVSLWPLYFTGMHKFYPGIMHARLMVEGFLAGFILGFLGTALPRLLEAPPLRRGELVSLLGLYLLTAGLHIGEQPRLGDLAFIALLVVFGGCLIPRILKSHATAPPGFLLAGLGLSSGLIGPILWQCGLQGWVSGSAMQFGGMLLNREFTLFPLLGVGAFLLPRFLGIPAPALLSNHTAKWAAALVAGLLLTSDWLEANDPLAVLPTALRGVALVAYLLVMIPFHRQARPIRTVSLAAQLALVAVVAGVCFPLIWPAQRLAGLHIVFLGGYSLLIFAVATRVVLGHSGHEALQASRLPGLQVATALLVLGSILRAAGDFLSTRPHWLSGASYLWMLAAVVWGWAILPKVRQAESL